MQLGDRRLRPNQQPAPRRRIDAEQHHMRLIALLGINALDITSDCPIPPVSSLTAPVLPWSRLRLLLHGMLLPNNCHITENLIKNGGKKREDVN